MSGGTRELKVGLFVFIAFILLAVMVFSISDFYTAEPHYDFRVRFSFANGIEPGAPVRLAGVSVGEVRSVRVYMEEASQKMQAELGIRLSRGAQIEENAVAYINTLGFIGEKYLEIIPGTPGTKLLAPGDILVGKDSIPAEQLMASGYQVVRKLEETISSINSVIGDEGTRNALKGTLANSQEATKKLSVLLDNTNSVMEKIRDGQGTIGRLLTQDDLYKDLQALVADMRAHPWKLLYRPKESRK